MVRTLAQCSADLCLAGSGHLVSAPIITANREVERDSNKWTILVGGGVGRVFLWGSQPMNIDVQAYYNVAKPQFVGD